MNTKIWFGDRLAWPAHEYARMNGINVATLKNMWKRGDGPAYMQIGQRRYVTREAHEDYRRRIERRPADVA
jgi:hypothetical protein